MTTTVQPRSAVDTDVGFGITIEPTIENVGDLRVHLTGELDAWSAPQLTRPLAGLRPSARGPAEGPRQILLDLHELNFLDSTGLGALVDSRDALLADGWLVTAGPAKPQVYRLVRFAARAGWLSKGSAYASRKAPAHHCQWRQGEGAPR